MQYIMSKDDIDKLLSRLTLTIDGRGVKFDNTLYSWDYIRSIDPQNLAKTTGKFVPTTACFSHRPKLDNPKESLNIVQGI